MKRLTKLFTNNEKYDKISIGKSDLTGNNIWFADVEDFLLSNNEWKKLLDENQYERVFIKNDKDMANAYAIGYIGESLKPTNIFAIEIFEFREIKTDKYVSVVAICEIEKEDGDYKVDQTSFDDLQFYAYDDIRSEQLINQNKINNINIYKKVRTREQFFNTFEAINEGL